MLQSSINNNNMNSNNINNNYNNNNNNMFILLSSSSNNNNNNYYNNNTNENDNDFVSSNLLSNNNNNNNVSVSVCEVRTVPVLEQCDGVVLPGGESTTMALLAKDNGMLSALRSFSGMGRPIWGTCAGLIFLAKQAVGAKTGGQALLENLDVTVHRNFFGSQIHSFETMLPAPTEIQQVLDNNEENNNNNNNNNNKSNNSNDSFFHAVFIRAPAIIRCGSDVNVLSEYKLDEPVTLQLPNNNDNNNSNNEESDNELRVDKVIVAVRCRHLLATAFHPELTGDVRWHALFTTMVLSNKRMEMKQLQDGEGDE